MSRNAGRAVAASCTLGVLVGVGIFFYAGAAGDRAAAQAIPDVGKFRAGSELGEERAGFSGRHKLMIFADPNSPAWASVSSCIQSAEVTARMGPFTGILIDPAVEPNVEAGLRTKAGLQVIVRSLSGGFLGGLPSGFTCEDLVSLIEGMAIEHSTLEKSPIYASLLERPQAVVDDLVSKGHTAEANKYVDLLEEFEGSASPAVQAAKGRVGR